MMDVVEVKLSSLTVERLNKLGRDPIDFKINALIDCYMRGL